MDDQNKNLLLATSLSLLVILVWFFLFPPEVEQNLPAPDQTAVSDGTSAGDPNVAPSPLTSGIPGGALPESTSGLVDRAEALAQAERITIETPSLVGSISLVGGRIDDLSLSKYKETLAENSSIVRLLSPAGTEEAYYTLFGWVPAGTLDYSQVPGPTTPWLIESGSKLTPEDPVTLYWDNGEGLVFRRTISVDENYMFNIAQQVSNRGNSTVRIAPYGIIARHGEPDSLGFFILHEGVVRMSDGELKEIDYNDLPDLTFSNEESANVELHDVQQNGWIGFTDKYWMMTLIPSPGQPFKSVAKFTERSDIYQTEARLPTIEIGPGAASTVETKLFAGAKEWEAIRDYEQRFGIERFIDSIDWGWFFFLTKPIFMVLHWLNGIIGNMGWSIIGLTVIIKAFLFPLAYKSYVSMARMKDLQPEMERIKEKVGDDKKKLQTEMMALYKTKKINPASGCLPILPQIPIFFSLYKVIFVTIELRHAPFALWIRDLSAPDPTSILNLFGALPWSPPDPASLMSFISLGVLPILLGVSMWLQQKLNPAPTDPTQAAIFAWLPWIFMFMLGRFASGLIIYWIANNLITFLQQYVIMRSLGMKPDIVGNIVTSFRKRIEKKDDDPPANAAAKPKPDAAPQAKRKRGSKKKK